MVKDRLLMTNVNTYLRGFLVDSLNDFVGRVDFENSLLEMRRITGATNIEIVKRYVDGRLFAFVHGVLSTGKATALDKDNNIVMINPIIVVGVRQMRGCYEMRSLTDEEEGFIRDHLGLMFIHDDKTGGRNSYCVLNVSTTAPKAVEAKQADELNDDKS